MRDNDIYRDLEILPGVEPYPDSTPNSTQHYTSAQGIRFVDGKPQKIGGWSGITFDNSNSISGKVRNIFSYVLDGVVRYLIGTNLNLYDLNGSTLTNITPLVVTTTPIANSISTNYKTLGSNPIATTLNSNVITIIDVGTKVRSGDSVTLSGATSTNGIPNTEINATHFVRTQTINGYTVFCTSLATSAGNGGGASVIQKTKIITIAQTAHGFLEGGRVKLLAATDVGGVLAAAINIEQIIRNVSVNAYDIYTADTATSSVSGGGGADTTVQGEIAGGVADATFGAGYGLGEYGVGLYGTPKMSASALLPTIWSFDRFGDNIIINPGQQTGVYTWDGDTSIAPLLVENAPAAVNYIFESNEILVTFGADGVGNSITWSDQGDSTDWTADITNQAGQDNIEGSDTFIAAAKLVGLNLLFTNNAVYTFQYIGLNSGLVWQTQLIEEGPGLIAQNALAVHAGIAYWQGQKNFYMYRGLGIEIIPSNSSTQTTMRRFIFDNINFGQISKCFAWYNKEYNEIWFHSPSAGSNECDRLARLNLADFSWVMDVMDRTAGESPVVLNNPLLSDSSSVVYAHEIGHDADGSPLPFSLTGPFSFSGLKRVKLGGVVPDSIQTGNLTVSLNIKNYAQQTPETAYTEPVTPTTTFMDWTTEARYWQYQISGNDLGQDWKAGAWQEKVSQGNQK